MGGPKTGPMKRDRNQVHKQGPPILGGGLFVHLVLGPLLGSDTGSVFRSRFRAHLVVRGPAGAHPRAGWETTHRGVVQDGPPVTAACRGVLPALRRVCLDWRRGRTCAPVCAWVPGRAPEPNQRPVQPGRRFDQYAWTLPRAGSVLPGVRRDPVSTARSAPVHGPLVPIRPGRGAQWTLIRVGGWSGVSVPGCLQAHPEGLACERPFQAPKWPVLPAPRCKCWGRLRPPLPA